MKAALDDLLHFWLDRPDGAGRHANREIWFKSTPEFDSELHARFIDLYEEAAKGACHPLACTPYGALAELILLDQIPRNIFRGTKRMYATDDRALAAAERAVALEQTEAILPESLPDEVRGVGRVSQGRSDDARDGSAEEFPDLGEGFDLEARGEEFYRHYLALALALAVMVRGAGALSIDRALGGKR